MLYLVLLLIFVLLICQTKSEGFVEMFGFSGHSNPKEAPTISVNNNGVDTTNFIPIEGGMTHDDVNSAVTIVTNFITKSTDLCVYPIETSKIEKLINVETGSEFIKVRFMYMVTNTGFPFVFGVDAEILDGRVVVANTQEIYRNGKQDMSNENFLPFSEIENFQIYSR